MLRWNRIFNDRADGRMSDEWEEGLDDGSKSQLWRWAKWPYHNWYEKLLHSLLYTRSLDMTCFCSYKCKREYTPNIFMWAKVFGFLVSGSSLLKGVGHYTCRSDYQNSWPSLLPGHMAGLHVPASVTVTCGLWLGSSHWHVSKSDIHWLQAWPINLMRHSSILRPLLWLVGREATSVALIKATRWRLWNLQ